MTENFKWHKVTDKEKEEIKKDAKKLLTEFASKLTSIKVPEGHFAPQEAGYIGWCENESGQREEGDGWNTDPDFRDLMFLNAPFVEDETIVAEKGGWK